MPGPQASATAVVIARLPPCTRPESWRALDSIAGHAGGCVTWAADAGTLTALAPDATGDWALALDGVATATRRDLRAVLALVSRLPAAIEAVVAPAGVSIVHRDLLVDAGIRIAAMDRFDDAGRGSRRPAPDGWACRSVVWGLWEAAATTPAHAGIARWLPWGGRPAAGSLTLTTVDLDPDARIAGAVLGKALGRFHDRRGVRMARLRDLPALLGGEGPSRSGSVLRAA